MAESKKGDSSASVKKKDGLEDLDIGNDFFTSWKSMSMAEEDGLDFDLTPAPKGNKKPFNFDKADMDFNLDGDFGKISSFNMDMSDLDISPTLEKDGKSKEKSKESSTRKDKGSSFNMDMSDLDFSVPLKKDRKEKPKESSSGKSKGEDHFAFTFDFDEMDNFSFGSSLETERSKAQKDKDKKEGSPDGSGCQDKEGSMHLNVNGSTSTKEDGPQKPSLPESRITFDMDSLAGENADVEPTRKTSHSNVAVDDAVATEYSAATKEVASDKAKTSLEKTLVSNELPNNSQSVELVSPGPVELEACTQNDPMQELSSDYPSNIEPSGYISSESQNKVDFMHTNGTGPDGEQDADLNSVAGSTCKYKNTLSENSQNLPTVAMSEFVINENSQGVDEDHVIDDRGKTELGYSLVENPYTNSAVSEILCDAPSGKENQEPASMIPKLSLISQPSDLSKKQTDNRIEPLVESLQPSVQPEKPKCHLLKVSTQTIFSTLSSTKMGPAQPSLVGERRDGNAIQSVKKLSTPSLQPFKTPLRGELPQTQSQGNCNGAKICGELGNAEGLQNGQKKMNDSSETQIKDMVKTKQPMMQRKMHMKDLDTLSMDINKKAAKNNGNPSTLASIPTTKNFPVKQLTSSIEGVMQTPNFPGLTLTGLSRDSTKSPLQKDCKSVRNSGQTSVLFQKTPPIIAHFADGQKQKPSTLSLKRTLEDPAANNIVHPSKRLSRSSSTNRNLVETSEKALNKKVASHSNLEDGHMKSPIDNRLITAIQVPHEVKTKGLDIYSIQNNSNIKLADAYSKELDDLCNMLRKKHDEAKETLARAIVNSNKLLMLNKPQFEERISFKLSTIYFYGCNNILDNAHL